MRQHDLAEITSVGVARLAEQGAGTIRVECRGDAVRVARASPVEAARPSSAGVTSEGLRQRVPVDRVRECPADTGVVERRPSRVEAEITA